MTAPVKFNHSYQTHTPDQLRGLVVSIWEQKVSISVDVRHHIMPLGKPILFFLLDGKTELVNASKISPSEAPLQCCSYFVGVPTERVLLKIKKYHLVGVTFTPPMAKLFMKQPLHTMTDLAIEAEDLQPGVVDLWEQLMWSSSFTERRILLEQWLLDLLEDSFDLRVAVKMMKVLHQRVNVNPEGSLPIQQISGYSRAQTHRLFKSWFGVSPAHYWRYQKFLKSLELSFNSSLSWRDIALESGFYDLSHLNRTYQEFCHMNPTEYRAEATNCPLLGHLMTHPHRSIDLQMVIPEVVL